MAGHLGGAALNITGGLILGLGYGHWEDAAITMVMGTIAGTIREWTMPKGAMRAVGRYRAGDIEKSASSPHRWIPTPWVNPSGTGLAITGSF